MLHNDVQIDDRFQSPFHHQCQKLEKRPVRLFRFLSYLIANFTGTDSCGGGWWWIPTVDTTTVLEVGRQQSIIIYLHILLNKLLITLLPASDLNIKIERIELNLSALRILCIPELNHSAVAVSFINRLPYNVPVEFSTTNLLICREKLNSLWRRFKRRSQR